MNRVISVSIAVTCLMPFLAASAAENLPWYFGESGSESRQATIATAGENQSVPESATDKQAATKNLAQADSQSKQQDKVAQQPKSAFSWKKFTKHLLYGPSGVPQATDANLGTRLRNIGNQISGIAPRGYYPTGYNNYSLMPSQTLFSNGASATTYPAMAPGMPSQTIYSNGASATTYPSLAPGMPTQTLYSNGISATTFPPLGRF